MPPSSPGYGPGATPGSVPGATITRVWSLGRLPRIEFGSGTFERVPDIVRGLGTRVLLVTGVRSFAGSERESVLRAALGRVGVSIDGEVRVDGEPTPEVVDGAVAAHREAGVEVVLAIGGGSVLDTGKAVAGLLRAGTSVMDHLEEVGRGLPYAGPAVPLVAVPTTAGTGSEATRNAVLSRRGPEGFKRSFRDERLVPAVALVDPDLLAGASRGLIAANGMDALAQLIESVVSVGASPITDALALDGLRSARAGLLAWHGDPDGPGATDARASMAYASLLSGICLANAGLGAVHGLAAPLGALLPIPHGVACGAVLREVVAVNLGALAVRTPDSPALSRFAALGRLLADLPADSPDDEARDALLGLLGAWTSALGIDGLSAYGLNEAGIEWVAARCRAGSMRTNPVTLTDAELIEVLTRSL